MNAMRFLFKVLAVLICMIVLAAVLMPVNPKPSKKQLQRMRSQFEIMDLAVGFEKYKVVYQSYPSGNGLLIWRQLAGDNPQKIIFAEIKASSISTNGEFLDPWGTPCAINFPSTNSFVVSSAGKDKVFGDADDIIFNSISNGFVKP
jgi:hypothetical protein